MFNLNYNMDRDRVCGLLGVVKSAPPFCDCHFPSGQEVAWECTARFRDVDCRCGEEVGGADRVEWHWDQTPDNVDCVICGVDVTFHPIFSQGTSIVRGERPLEVGKIHYWEIRMLSNTTGTDVMIGLGTDKVDLGGYRFHFVSALGADADSWGYSYRGFKQHKAKHEIYGLHFSQGCLLGVYLDLNRGVMEYYLNRKSLGVAFTDIPTDGSVQLYPMVSSTAAKSAIRLINAISETDNLKMKAFRALGKCPSQLQELRAMRGLKSLTNAYWFLAMPTRYSNRSKENEIPLEDEVVVSLKRARKIKYTDEEPDTDDVYSNAEKISSIRDPVDDEDFLYFML